MGFLTTRLSHMGQSILLCKLIKVEQYIIKVEMDCQMMHLIELFISNQIHSFMKRKHIIVCTAIVIVVVSIILWIIRIVKEPDTHIKSESPYFNTNVGH